MILLLKMFSKLQTSEKNTSGTVEAKRQLRKKRRKNMSIAHLMFMSQLKINIVGKKLLANKK